MDETSGHVNVTDRDRCSETKEALANSSHPTTAASIICLPSIATMEQRRRMHELSDSRLPTLPAHGTRVACISRKFRVERVMARLTAVIKSGTDHEIVKRGPSAAEHAPTSTFDFVSFMSPPSLLFCTDATCGHVESIVARWLVMSVARQPRPTADELGCLRTCALKARQAVDGSDGSEVRPPRALSCFKGTITPHAARYGISFSTLVIQHT